MNFKYCLILAFFVLAGCGKADESSSSTAIVISSVKERTNIILENRSRVQISLDGWKLQEEISTSFFGSGYRTYTIPPQVLNGGYTVIFGSRDLGFQLERDKSAIYLYDNAGTLIDVKRGSSFNP